MLGNIKLFTANYVKNSWNERTVKSKFVQILFKQNSTIFQATEFPIESKKIRQIFFQMLQYITPFFPIIYIFLSSFFVLKGCQKSSFLGENYHAFWLQIFRANEKALIKKGPPEKKIFAGDDVFYIIFFFISKRTLKIHIFASRFFSSIKFIQWKNTRIFLLNFCLNFSFLLLLKKIEYYWRWKIHEINVKDLLSVVLCVFWVYRTYWDIHIIHKAEAERKEIENFSFFSLSLDCSWEKSKSIRHKKKDLLCVGKKIEIKCIFNGSTNVDFQIVSAFSHASLFSPICSIVSLSPFTHANAIICDTAVIPWYCY